MADRKATTSVDGALVTASAARLRAALEASGMTAYRLAKETGLPQPAVSRLLNGRRPVLPHHAEALGAALKVAPASLLPTSAGLDQPSRSTALVPAPVPRVATVSPTGVSDPRAKDRLTVAAYVEAHAQDLSPREIRFLQTMGARTVGNAALTDDMLAAALAAFRESLRG